MVRTYANLDLVVTTDQGGYVIDVASPEGRQRAPFASPFSTLEIENFALKTRPAPAGVRRAESPEIRLARATGTRLFEAVFTGSLRTLLRDSVSSARDRGDGLRLRVSVPPELSVLPWEYLYAPDFDRFLSVSSETLLVRYLPNDEGGNKLPVTPPLRVLVMIATPQGYPAFDAGGESDSLKDALASIGERGLVTVDWLGHGTWRGLQQRLRRRAYHVVHFIGHGIFDERTHEGMLVFEREEGGDITMSAASIGAMLHDHQTLRLVVLNACDAGRPSAVSPYGGVAQALVRAQIPAVIAMQSEISDKAAAVFAREFYGAIADGYPVDASLGEARKAMFADPKSLEWGTPALYTRWPHGELFDLGERGQAGEHTLDTELPLLGNAALRFPDAEADRADDRDLSDRAGTLPAPLPGPTDVRPVTRPAASTMPLMSGKPSALKPSPDATTKVPQRRREVGLPLALLAAIFVVNLVETALETHWSTWFPDRGWEFASALHWLENGVTFENHELAGEVPFFVYGYSIAYFFLFPVLGLLFAWVFARRAEPYAFRTYSAALGIDYLISLPFFVLFPVPERWAFPDADSILLSDLWSSALIDAFRPISAIDNCFPSFHTSMTVVMVLCAYLYSVRFRTTVVPLATMIIVSTYGLGIHWLGDIVTGLAVGLISVALAYAIVHRRGRARDASAL